MANELSRLYVVIGARTDGFVKGMENAQKQLNKFNKTWGRSMRTVGMGMMALGGSIVAAGVLSAKTFAEMGDALEEMSQRTGWGIEALSEIKYAAELSGTSLEGVELASKRLPVTLTSTGGAGAKAIGALGLSIDELRKLAPDQQFLKVATALASLPDPTQKAGLAVAIFGKSGTDILPMLANSAEGLDRMRQEARDLGLVMDKETAAKAAKFKDAMQKLQGQVQGLKLSTGEALVPALKSLIDTVTPLIKRFTDFADKHPKLVQWGFKLGIALVVVGGGLYTVGKMIKPVSDSLKLAIGLVKVLRTVYAALSTVLRLKVIPSMVATRVAQLGIATSASGLLTVLGPLAIAGAAAGVGYGIYKLWNWASKAGDFKTGGPDWQSKEKLTGYPDALDVVRAYAREHPNIPGMASGGIVTRPTLATVGERGPEAIVPLRDSSGIGSTVVNVTVQGSVIASQDLGRLIRQELLKIKERNYNAGLA